MNKKVLAVILLIVISIILNEIFTALDLVWYIQLAPFVIAIIGYIFIEINSRLNK